MITRRICTAILIATLAAVLATQNAEMLTQAKGEVGSISSSKVDFETDILPIFKNSCFACHGEKKQMVGLRLDVKKFVLAGSDLGKIIKPHNAAESPLYRRVAGIGEEMQMPMGTSPLDAEQIELIRKWIQQGADWSDINEAGVEKHWAYVPPEQPVIPKTANQEWVSNPIDSFVLAQLKKESLSPSTKANRVTLLRRLSLDLIGLPPTIEEADAFLADKSEKAYEKQIERLLQSPHYGERWGQHWLDAARYADSDGYEKDLARKVWFYRDWVINALNHDMPYDQFVIEQLAGDLLPNATQDQKVATGFLRNSMVNEEGGIDPEQFRMEAMFDRMDTVGKSILGLTTKCAQCHDHKYDPIRQEDYYRTFAFLNNTHEAKISVYTPDEQEDRSRIFSDIQKIEADLKHKSPAWESRMASWEDLVQDNQPKWAIIQPTVDRISAGGQKWTPMKDGSFLLEGYSSNESTVEMFLETEVQGITAIRFEVLSHPNLPLGGPGRSIFGTGALTEFKVEAGPVDAPETGKVYPDGRKKKEASPVKLAGATADISLPKTPLKKVFYDKKRPDRVTGPINFSIDDDENTAWGIDAGPGLRNQSRKAVFTFEKPVSYPQGTILTFFIAHKHGGWTSNQDSNNNLGRIRLSITTAPNAVADPLPKKVREITSIPRKQRTLAQNKAIFSYWRTTVPEWKTANNEIAKLWQSHPEGTTQLVLQRREEQRETSILSRGDFLKPVKVVSPGVPSFLHPLDTGADNVAPPPRLRFARWLVDRQSPTTARALVNRVWQSYFGIGLVSTSENLGTQGELPSHPELLDWLAVKFMDSGWRIKELHRLIVNSSTYRQSSRVTPELFARDPYNRLLARGPRVRVDAEIVRDIALTASGLLNKKIGGPSVYPPAPGFLFVPPASYGTKTWNESEGEDRYRRALYTFRYRSVPYPALQAFDAPVGDFSVVRRTRSNTPLQALTTLNETLFLESARALAIRTLQEGGTTNKERLIYAFRRCLTRTPSEQESVELLSLLNRQRSRLQEGWMNPWALADYEPSERAKMPKGVTPVQLASWTAVSRVLLNLDETITKE